MKREMKRKGFTLVELLIVIVVIGILSAMMMLSSTEAVTSAKASNIVSNLRNLKTAALALYNDKMDDFTGNTATWIADYIKTGAGKDLIWSYLGSGNDIPDKDNYKLTVAAKDGDGSWWVMCNITGSTAEIASIKKKLEGRAKSLGLKGIKDFNTAIGMSDKAPDFTASGNYGAVMMMVR